MGERQTKRFLVRGQVQGVGYRYFVEKWAQSLGLDGSVRNLDDGSVEVLAVGTAEELAALSGHLWKGPRWAEVRGVEEREVTMIKYKGFRIQH